MIVSSVLKWFVSLPLLLGLTPHQHAAALQFLGARHQSPSDHKFFKPKLFENGRYTGEIFFPGPDGWRTPYYRIPALLALTQFGDASSSQVLLAFAEKRYTYSDDAGRVQVVMRRSDDNGRTWGGEQTLCDMGNKTCGNPAPVEDKNGHVHLLVSSNPFGKGETYANASGAQWLSGEVERKAWVIHSEDGGVTWTDREEITSSVKKSSWLWFATGPGHGIRLSKQANNDRNGRLVVGADHSSIVDDSGRICYSSHVIYSDDNGKTWGVQDPWQFANSTQKGPKCRRSNEASIVETEDGNLMIYSRQLTHEFTHLHEVFQHKLPAERVHALFAKSSDGGDTWDGLQRNGLLGKLPTCEGSLVRHTDSDGHQRILLSHPVKYNEYGGREHLSIDVSLDGGETWPREQRIAVHKGNAGYSDMQVLSDGTLVLLHEMSAEGIHMRLYKRAHFSS